MNASNVAYQRRLQKLIAKVVDDARNANTSSQEAKADREAAAVLRTLRATASSKSSRNRKIAFALMAVIVGGAGAAIAYKAVLGKSLIAAALSFSGRLPGMLSGGVGGAAGAAWGGLWRAYGAASRALGRVTDPITRTFAPHLLNNAKYTQFKRESNLTAHRWWMLGGAYALGRSLMAPKAAAAAPSAPVDNSLEALIRSPSASPLAKCRYGVSRTTGDCRRAPPPPRRRQNRRQQRSRRRA